SDCPQMHLTPDQLKALEELETQLQPMIGPEKEKLWTEQAMQTHPQWIKVRQSAREALQLLDLLEREAVCKRNRPT
ncbi:MAG: hypothetical protein ACK4UN_17505, partial [Limisphaerales bacterium]